MGKIKLLLFFSVVTFIISIKPLFATSVGKLIIETSDLEIKKNQIFEISIFTDTSIPVNAIQLKLDYPLDNYKVIFIDTSKSDYHIKAEEKLYANSIKIVRGNISSLKGKHLFAIIKFKALKNGNINQISFENSDNLIMESETNQNIYSDIVEIRKVDNAKIKSPFSIFDFINRYFKN